MSSVDVLILGAGPTGLGAAWELNKHAGAEWLLCEQNSQVGGLSRSIRDDAGYTWDIGGHVCFSHYDEFSTVLSRAMGPDGCFEHDREAWVHAADSWVPYPFQNNLHRLDAADRERCLAGLVTAAEQHASSVGAAPRNFAEFITATFGAGIAEIFMTPYNEKVWAHPLTQMSYGWIGERVSVPDPQRARRAMETGADDLGWGPNNRFLFPRSGGTGAFWSRVTQLLPAERVRTAMRAMRIDSARREVEFEDGSTVRYSHLITTVPLDATAKMLGDAELVETTSWLAHNSVHVVGLGVDALVGAKPGPWCWMYFPGTVSPFYRVTNFSHYSPAHVPGGGSSLIAEVSESPTRPVDPECLVDGIIAGLVSEGVLEDAAQVSHIWTHQAEYGYPIPSLGRDAIVGPALATLEARGILSRGRFGAWKYEVGNMDHSFMQGVEAVSHILTGASEVTLDDPALVNAQRPALGRNDTK